MLRTPVDYMLRFDSHLYIGDALQYFFSHAVINLFDGDNPINLLDYFPYLKNGGSLWETCLSMSYLYIEINGLLDNDQVTVDQLMIDSFAANIPAKYYFDGYRKITMEQALSEGLINEPLNVFQVVKHSNPKFDFDSLNMSYYRDILLFDVNKYQFINTQVLEEENFCQKLKLEFSLLREIGDVLRRYASLCPDDVVRLDHIDIIEIYRIASQEMSYELPKIIEKDPKVNKLLLAIINNDITSVRQYVKVYDPRDNSHKAYLLAININNFDIIKLVKDTIIQRTMLERRVFRTQIEQIIGMKSSIPEDVYDIARKRF